MKKITVFIILLFVLNLPILIYLSNFRLMIYNKGFYLEEFRKNRVYDEVPNAVEVLDNLLLFFKNKAELGNYYTEDEASHLQDVKNLIFGATYVFYSSFALEILLILVLILNYRKNISRFFKTVGFIFMMTGFSILLLSLVLYIFSGSFSDMFVKFHLIFFPWGNWQFPDTSILLKMFPEEFFYNFTYKAVSNAVFTAVITTVTGMFFFVPKWKIKKR